MRVKGFVATLAVLAAGMTASAARAEVVTSPVKALALMTEARVAGARCGYLSAAEQRELTDYAARVELVAVQRAGADAARKALLEGRRLGGGSCSEAEREKVLAVLEGARRAARGAQTVSMTRVAPVRRSSEPERQRSKVRMQRASWQPVAKAGRPGPVGKYVALASAYYHALKCRNRSRAELMRMWRNVRDMHYRLVRKVGGAAVARAKREAARRGNARACR